MADEAPDIDEHEQNVYGEDAREDMMEGDEITPEEDAFMQGYDEAEETDEEPDDSDYEEAFED